MSYVDVYAEAFVISMCDVLDKANQLTGNNKGERRYDLAMQSMFSCQERSGAPGKIYKQSDRQPSPFGPLYRPK